MLSQKDKCNSYNNQGKYQQKKESSFFKFSTFLNCCGWWLIWLSMEDGLSKLLVFKILILQSILCAILKLWVISAYMVETIVSPDWNWRVLVL